MRKKDVLREALREIGRKGGKATAKSLTAKQRTERARKGGLSRQAKARQAKRDEKALEIIDKRNREDIKKQRKGGAQ
jgi:hypothetical protein